MHKDNLKNETLKNIQELKNQLIEYEELLKNACTNIFKKHCERIINELKNKIKRYE